METAHLAAVVEKPASLSQSSPGQLLPMSLLLPLFVLYLSSRRDLLLLSPVLDRSRAHFVVAAKKPASPHHLLQSNFFDTFYAHRR
jgi:hypothetical protein